MSHVIERVWPVAALLVLIVFFFHESATSLQNTWRSYEGYDHGFFVVGIWLISLMTVESRKDTSDHNLPSKTFVAVTVLVLALVSFFNNVGARFEIEIVQYATTFLFAVTGALLITRPASLFKFIVLAIFLASGMPLWGFVLNVLQILTIQLTEVLLRIVAVPVLFTGDMVDLPYGRLRIAEGCGGLRYFLSALAISAFYVFLYIDDLRRGSLFVFVTCMLALIANWIRVAGIVWIAYASEMQSDLVQDHYMYGWIIFAIFLIPAFWLGQRFQHVNAVVH